MPSAPLRDALDRLPPLRTVIAEHGLSARKRLGQHFLLDLNLTGKIAATAGDLAKGTTIEVGPGPGGLTRALLSAGATQIIAIERDPRCVAALQGLQAVAEDRLTVVEGDAQKVDIARLGQPPRRVVANLPYNVATALLTSWMAVAEHFQSFTLMFQKEVAERITAKPGDPAYGRLAVLANWRCRTEMSMTLPARAFTPPPKVDSAVVHLVPSKDQPHACSLEDLQKVTAAAFGQRRKMLRRALRPLGVDVEKLLTASQIDPTRRAEELDIAAFARLTRTFSNLRGAP